VVTCPIHPWFGRELPVSRGPLRFLGREVIELEDADGRRLRLPLEWTDRRPTRPCPLVNGRRLLVEAERLVAATRWVQAQTEKLTTARTAGGCQKDSKLIANTDASDVGGRRRGHGRKGSGRAAGDRTGRGAKGRGPAVDRPDGAKSGPRSKRKGRR